MLKALDNINRSQDYLINLGFEVVDDEYEVFRQFIVKNNNEEYDNYRKYLIKKYNCGDKYINIILRKLRYQNYYIIIKYVWFLKIHYLGLEISNGGIVLQFNGNNQFIFLINNYKIGERIIFYDNFEEYCINLDDSNNRFIINNLMSVNDILDKIDCEILNELDPLLYKMFMTIFNKPIMKSANNTLQKN